MTRLVPLFFCALFGVPACGSPRPVEATVPPSSADSASKPTPVGVSARVTQVEPSRESVMYVIATVVFENKGPSPCALAGYTLRWGTSTKVVAFSQPGSVPAPMRITIPAGGVVQRTVRVDPNDGDLAALTATSARVELAECRA